MTWFFWYFWRSFIRFWSPLQKYLLFRSTPFQLKIFVCFRIFFSTNEIFFYVCLITRANLHNKTTTILRFSNGRPNQFYNCINILNWKRFYYSYLLWSSNTTFDWKLEKIRSFFKFAFVICHTLPPVWIFIII
jgi:hypothetical protein